MKNFSYIFDIFIIFLRGKKSVRARYLVAKTDISYDPVFYAHLHDSTTKATFTRAAEYALKRQGPYSFILEI